MGGIAALDVEHVALDLRFDMDRQQAAGTATIHLRSKQETSRIVLDAVGLDVRKIEWQGEGPVGFELVQGRENGALVIDLGRAVTPADPLVFTIQYTAQALNGTDPSNIWGSVGRGLRFHAPSASDPRRRVQMWSSNAPGSNRRWFPGYDRPDDLRTFEIRATVGDARLTALSNGALIAREANPDESVTYHWKLDQPQQNHRSSIVIGEFENAAVKSKSLTLNNYGYPDEMDGVRASVERLTDMADFLRETISQPFPFKAYTQVFVQELPWGMANSGLAVLTENFVDSAEVHRDFLYLWDDLEAESLAEQWFGNSIAPQSWEDAWLARGLPRYLSAIYNESRNGEEELLLSPYHVPADLQAALSDWANEVRDPIAPTSVADPSTWVTANTPTVRATVVLRMLEGEIGRDALIRSVRRLAALHSGGLVSTNDFAVLVSDEAARDMSWFFDQWIYGAGHPKFTVDQEFSKERGELVITVGQSIAQGSANGAHPMGLFRGDVDIEIDGKVERRTLAPMEVNTFTFPRSSAPRFVNFDYKSRWIAETYFPRGSTELLAIARSSTDALARRKAMIELGNMALDPATSVPMRDAILEHYREVAESDAYWRLKMVALFQLRRVLNANGGQANFGLDEETHGALVRIIRGQDRDEAWVRFAALNWLGEARDPKHFEMFRSLLRDKSDRVINAAAVALGKTKDPRAFDTLIALGPHPSWKNQSRISMLGGLAELGDPRGVDVALASLKSLADARWTLITPVWDYRLAAAHALRRLESTAEGYRFVRAMLDKALGERHVSDTMYNLHLLVALADPQAREALSAARKAFAEHADMQAALDAIETQLNAALA
ncbi:MAG: M1 family aminopeptidase [Pseudomonadota bacterium]